MKKKKILVVAGEAWREDTNAGNVLVNLFNGMTDEYEFAQIYVSSQMPKNKICNKYFQFSEKELIHSVLKGGEFGHVLACPFDQNADVRDFTNSGRFYFFRQKFGELIYPIRNALWAISRWKSDRLKQFVVDFDPDIIFAPIYYYPFMARIVEFVQDICDKKIVSYTGDDYLTMKQFSLSPLYWTNRLVTRSTIKSLSKRYARLYTMTDEQKYEYEKILHIPINVFKKGGDFSVKPLKKEINRPIKIIYGGGLLFGRHTTIVRMKEAVANINRKYGHIFELYIYTQTPLSDKLIRILNDGENSFFMGKVGQEELMRAYSEAGIALHIESFKLAPKLDTKLSFSTKIIDLLKSNCCIMAICWEKSSPYIYLRNQDAAICVGNPNKIEEELVKIMQYPEMIVEYARKAWDCGFRNHRIEMLQQQFKNDFNQLISNNE